MNQKMNWLQKLGLRQIITVFLVAITFIVVPAFGYSQSLQAQADTLIAKGDSYIVDDATVKKIQDKAEDLGDSPERPIGDTGLKNIRKLGENIPETVKFNAEQKLGIDAPKDVLKGAQNQVDKAVEGTKQAVKNAAS